MRYLAILAAVLSVGGAHAESRYVLPFFGGGDRLYVTSAQDNATVEVCGAAGCAERAASPPDAVRPAAVNLDGVVEAGRQRVTVTSDGDIEVVAVRRGPPITFLPVVPGPPPAPPEPILLKSEVAAVAAGGDGWTIPPPGAACSHLAPADADHKAVFFAVGPPTAKVRPARACIATEPRPALPPGVRRYAIWWEDAHGGGVAVGVVRLFFRA